MSTKSNRNIIFYITSIIVLIIICVSLYFFKLILYSYVTLVLLILLIISLIIYLICIWSKISKFKHKVKKIIKEYSHCLVKIKEIPDFIDKEVCELESLDDLISRQVENNISISYFNDKLSTCFYIVIDNLVYYYVLKDNNDVINLIEEKFKLIKENNEDIDINFFKNLDKTATIELPNVGKYKISPVRDKLNENNNEVIETSNDVNEEKLVDKPEIIEVIEEVDSNNKKDDVSENIEVI